MKKRMILAGAFILLCLTGGCLSATPLTDGEMDVVAEYAASLMLKYEKKYDTPLFYTEELEKRLTPTLTLPEKPKQPTGTPTPIPKEDNPIEPHPAITTTPIPTPTKPPALLFNSEETTKQLTQIIGVKDIVVSCEGTELKKSVQSKEYFSLVAKEGRQYAVVSFKLTNSSDKTVKVDVSDKGLEYTIDVNTKTVSRVSLSMLENDLQYMEIDVPASGTAEAVLVFEIADQPIDTLHLIIEDKDDNAVFVKLQ